MARIVLKEGKVYTITNSRELKNVASQILEKFGEVLLEGAISISYANGKVSIEASAREGLKDEEATE